MNWKIEFKKSPKMQLKRDTNRRLETEAKKRGTKQGNLTHLTWIPGVRREQCVRTQGLRIFRDWKMQFTLPRCWVTTSLENGQEPHRCTAPNTSLKYPWCSQERNRFQLSASTGGENQKMESELHYAERKQSLRILLWFCFFLTNKLINENNTFRQNPGELAAIRP